MEKPKGEDKIEKQTRINREEIEMSQLDEKIIKFHEALE